MGSSNDAVLSHHIYKRREIFCFTLAILCAIFIPQLQINKYKSEAEKVNALFYNVGVTNTNSLSHPSIVTCLKPEIDNEPIACTQVCDDENNYQLKQAKHINFKYAYYALMQHT